MSCGHVFIGDVMVKLSLTEPEEIFNIVTDAEAEAYLEKRGLVQKKDTLICSWCVIEDRIYEGR
jgi:hypothetical protein